MLRLYGPLLEVLFAVSTISRLLIIWLLQQAPTSSVKRVPRPAFPKTRRQFQSDFATEEAASLRRMTDNRVKQSSFSRILATQFFTPPVQLPTSHHRFGVPGRTHPWNGTLN